MAGYFSNNGEGTDANAARQFEREFADNPRSFGGPGGGFLGRLIGARQPSNGITSEPLPDRTPPPEPQGGSNSSSPALVSRILTAMRPPMPPQWSQGAPPAHNGPPMQLPQQNLPNAAPHGPPDLRQQMAVPFQGAAPQGPPDLRQQMAVPFQGAGMPGQGMNMGPGGLGSPVQLPMDGMMPPMPQQPRGMSVNTDPALAGIPPQFHPRQLSPQQRQAMIAQAYATMNRQQQEQQAQQLFQRPPANYANGGYLRMMRGGYPADLMMGMPTRHDYARGSYVSPDGQGDGRSDHVDAKLSPGEYVIDATTTSALGNGDNSAGARKLDMMRVNIRKHQGKALAKGKFPPDAKSPESYLRKG